MSLSLLLFAQSLSASSSPSYEQKMLAALMVAEAGTEGTAGLTAVAEVVRTRAKERHKTVVQVMTQPWQFTPLNSLTLDQLYAKFKHPPAYATALTIAQTNTLPGLTKGANHFCTKDSKPKWAKGRMPVAVIGSHIFYKL